MELRYRHKNQDYAIQLEPRPDGTYAATIEDRVYSVQISRMVGGQVSLRLNGARMHAYVAACDTCKAGTQLRYVALVGRVAQTFELERVRESAQRGTSSGGGNLIAQMPGQVRQVLTVEGESVESGQALLILEAMKMEIRVTAPHAGTVTRLLVQQGDTVERGQQLAEVTLIP